MKLEVVFENGRTVTLDNVASFNATEQSNVLEVNPLGIDRSIFEEPRENLKQEWTRQRILEAFAEVNAHPKLYATTFYIMIPDKYWDGSKTREELEKYAQDLGGKMANWVEYSLACAQQISNDKSWEFCNKSDKSKWYRTILGKNGYAQLIGGSHISNAVNLRKLDCF